LQVAILSGSLYVFICLLCVRVILCWYVSEVVTLDKFNYDLAIVVPCFESLLTVLNELK